MLFVFFNNFFQKQVMKPFGYNLSMVNKAILASVN